MERSLPVRERGLKSERTEEARRSGSVAPRAGAWIEILYDAEVIKAIYSRSPCGSVD